MKIAANVDGRDIEPSTSRPAPATLSPHPKPAGEEFAAVAQALLVDAMSNARGHVPFGRNFEGGEVLG